MKNLTKQLILLARRADAEFPIDVIFSAETGTLDTTEVGLLLEWLAKAGYKWGNPDYEGRKSTLRIEWFDEDRLTGVRKYRWLAGHGKSIEAALTDALLALDLGDNDD